jgi:hypothetical protein
MVKLKFDKSLRLSNVTGIGLQNFVVFDAWKLAEYSLLNDVRILERSPS